MRAPINVNQSAPATIGNREELGLDLTGAPLHGEFGDDRKMIRGSYGKRVPRHSNLSNTEIGTDEDVVNSPKRIEGAPGGLGSSSGEELDILES